MLVVMYRAAFKKEMILSGQDSWLLIMPYNRAT